MQTVHKTPAVTVTARKTRDLDTDLLIIPVFEDDNLSDEPDLDRASGGEYGGARQRREFTGKLFEQLFTPLGGDGWKARRALWVGAGPLGAARRSRERLPALAAGAAPALAAHRSDGPRSGAVRLAVSQPWRLVRHPDHSHRLDR